MKFIPVQTSCDEYKYSFWPRKFNDWNSLPPNIINMTSISNFKVAVNNYISAEVLVLPIIISSLLYPNLFITLVAHILFTHFMFALCTGIC